MYLCKFFNIYELTYFLIHPGNLKLHSKIAGQPDVHSRVIDWNPVHLSGEEVHEEGEGEEEGSEQEGPRLLP